MKTWPTSFNTEKNKAVGARPVWILRLPINSVDYYLTAFPITIPSFATSTVWPQALEVVATPQVQSWGTIQTGIDGWLDEFQVTEFSVSLVVDPQNVDFGSLLTSYAVEGNSVELYLWFRGLSDPPQRIFKGFVRDISNLTETGVDISIQDLSIRLEKNYLGTKLTNSSYPSANKNDIGKIIPYVFGTVSKVPAVAVDAGWVTSLTYATTAGAATITVGELPSVTAVGKTIYIDSEQMIITAANTSTKVLTVTRGANSSTASTHSIGASVVEKKSTPTVFAFSAIPVTAVTTVYARYQSLDVDITSLCTRYTGATGSELTGYEGKSVVTIENTPTLLKNLALTLNNALAVDEGSHSHSTYSRTVLTMDSYNEAVTSTFFTVDGSTYDWAALYDGKSSTWFVAASHIKYFNTNAITDSSSTPTRVRVGILYAGRGGTAGTVKLYLSGSLKTTFTMSSSAAYGTYYSAWVAMTAWSTISATNSYAYLESSSGAKMYELWFEVETSATSQTSGATGVALTGDLSLSGNSTADVIVLDYLLADINNANRNTFQSACNLILSEGGLSETTSLVGTTPTYNCNGAIIEYKTCLYWLNYLALQFKSFFAVINGTPCLIARTGYATGSTISACKIDQSGLKSLVRKKTDVSQIVNYINVLYNRDYTLSGEDAYSSNTLLEDTTSQATYSVCETSDGFMFDFITSSTDASSLGNFYLANLKDRHWIAEFSVFLNNAEFEFGDKITLGFLNNTQGIIINASHAPGSSGNIDTIELTVLI